MKVWSISSLLANTHRNERVENPAVSPKLADEAGWPRPPRNTRREFDVYPKRADPQSSDAQIPPRARRYRQRHREFHRCGFVRPALAARRTALPRLRRAP